MGRTAKAWAAALGGTLAALTTFWAVLGPALDDGNLDAGEVGPLATAVVVLLGTVYAVWRVRNTPATSSDTTQRVRR